MNEPHVVLLLEKLKVDDACFVSPRPKAQSRTRRWNCSSPCTNNWQDEGVWIAWIKQRQQALQDVRRRLATGEQASNPASSHTSRPVHTAQQGGNFADADAIVCSPLRQDKRMATMSTS